MFYVRNYLSKRAPMGNPWRVATLRIKLKKKTLIRVNIQKLCHYLIVPEFHMSLRLSSILMAGTVMIYAQKVDQLFDDANSLLVEFNRAWKVKPNTDPILLPKRRAQAKKEAITLPEVPEDTDIGGDIQWPDFHASDYFIVELDKVDVGEPQPGEGDQHQADPKDITLPEPYDPSTNLFNCCCERFETEGDGRFETEGDGRFETEGDDEMVETREVEIPSPPRQDQHQQPAQQRQGPLRGRRRRRQASVLDNHQTIIPSRVYQDWLADSPQDVEIPSPPRQDQHQQPAQQRQGPLRGRRRRRQASVLDNHQTIIPASVYKDWLADSSDIVSRRRRNPKPKNIMSTKKVGELLELPASVVMGRLFKAGSGETYYPPPLLERWKGTHGSPCALPAPPLPPPSWSPGPSVEDLYSGRGSKSFAIPTEQVWEIFDNNDVPPELMDELRANLNGMSGDDINMATPGNSEDERSIPSTSSGKGVNKNSSRSNRKRSNDGLEPVSDDNGCHHPDPNFNVSRLSGNGPTLEQELLMETGPTQTQQPIIDQRTLEQKTDGFRTELKSHFETPRGPKVESLDKLTAGMNRNGAALLFYQTCVLASANVVKVEQKAPYEDILITRGPNM